MSLKMRFVACQNIWCEELKAGFHWNNLVYICLALFIMVSIWTDLIISFSLI